MSHIPTNPPIFNPQSPAPVFYFTGSRNTVHIHHCKYIIIISIFFFIFLEFSCFLKNKDGAGAVAGGVTTRNGLVPSNLRFSYPLSPLAQLTNGGNTSTAGTATAPTTPMAQPPQPPPSSPFQTIQTAATRSAQLEQRYYDKYFAQTSPGIKLGNGPLTPAGKSNQSSSSD